MKQLFFIAAIILVSLNSFSQTSTYVNGYYRSNGTYVSGYYRTTPNYTRDDNYSTIGNVNPYTGAYGTQQGGLNSSYYSSSYSTPTTYYNSYSTPSYYSSYSTYSTPTYYSSYSTPTYYSSYSTPSYYSSSSYSSSNSYYYSSSSTTVYYTTWGY